MPRCSSYPFHPPILHPYPTFPTLLISSTLLLSRPFQSHHINTDSFLHLLLTSLSTFSPSFPILCSSSNSTFHSSQENGSRKLPSLSHIHRLKSSDNLVGADCCDNAANVGAVTPTLSPFASGTASQRTSIPSTPVGAPPGSVTPTGDATSR